VPGMRPIASVDQIATAISYRAKRL